MAKDTAETHTAIIRNLERFFEHAKSVQKLFIASVRGITLQRDLHEPLQEIAREAPGVLKYTAEEWKIALEDSKEFYDFAIKEKEKGYPLLHEMTLVGLWGAFEAAMEDVVVAFLLHEPKLFNSEKLAKIRIPFAEYEAASPDERMRTLLAEYQRTLRSDQRRGVTAFEAIFEIVDLDG